MFRAIVLAAAVAGLVAGVVLTGVQMLRVLPLIEAAEHYETSVGAAAEPAAHGPAAEEAWQPQGVARLALTLVANVVLGFGLALVLIAAAAAAGRRLDWQRGLLWGLAGYAVFHLAPAFGLPPELPGMPAAALGSRQLWWMLAVGAAGLGLAAVVFSRRPRARFLGMGLIVAPQIVGAPHAPFDASTAIPAILATAFVGATLFANLLFWLAIGGAAGMTFQRLAPARD